VLSFNTMSVRNRNAEVGKTSASDNNSETRSVKVIATSKARYGTTAVARPRALRIGAAKAGEAIPAVVAEPSIDLGGVVLQEELQRIADSHISVR
jgi:hypothetical protein